MSDKIVYTVAGYKLVKDLQNEINETKELESKYSDLNKSRRKDKNKMNIFNIGPQKKTPTILFSEIVTPTNKNLYASMKDNLNITSLLLKPQKPRTANPQLTNERLKTFTINSNFSTTNNFFTGKQTNETQNLDVTTLSRIAIRNSKKDKVPVNVNETRRAMVPAGHSQLPSIILEENKAPPIPENKKHELLRLRYDEAKLEKIIASTEQKKKEMKEVNEIVQKKLLDKMEYNREYFNKKDPYWKSFFDSKKMIQQTELINENFGKRLCDRIQSYQDCKYRRDWLKIMVGKHHIKKSPLMFGREDLREFEAIINIIRKNVRSSDEVNPHTFGKDDYKRSKTNISKISSDKQEKD